MQMDSRIILAGQPVNALRAMQEGTNLAAQTMQMRDHQAMQDLYRQHGAGILAGDQNALNALAGRDPMAALNVQSTQQGMRAREQEIGIAKENARLRGLEFAQNMDAAQRQQALDDVNRAGAMMTQATTPEQFAAILQMPGVTESVEAIFGPGFATVENRDLIIAGAAGLKEALSMNAAPAPLTDEGKRTVDQRNGYIDPNAGPVVDPEDVDKFRKEFSGLPAVKAFSEQSQAFGRIVASAKDPSPAGDLALIFNFMKVLDPGSVVRESEFATAAQASAWLQQSEEMGVTVPRPIAAAIRSMANGQRLSPEQRQDFVGRAASLYDNAAEVYGNVEAQFKSIAEARGYPMGQAVIDYRYTGERGVDPSDLPPPNNQPIQGGSQAVPQYQLDPETDALLRGLLQ